jgi:four helix bundle protein
MPPWDLVERTRAFALDVLSFCRKLPPANEARARDAGRQLLRAATSLRSNYRSARRSRSRAEFRSKLHIAFEEADECVDWLEYLRDAGIQHDTTLVKEAQEIARILAAAVRSACQPTTHC